MYDTRARRAALDLLESGLTISQASRATSISRAAIRSWSQEPSTSRPAAAECPFCSPSDSATLPGADYSYLLGLYLGDGCLSTGRRGVHALRIACADAHPGLADECARAIGAVRPQNKVCRERKAGCAMVTSCSKHWPCYFPQHGPGPKHLRRIQLSYWQQELVSEHPWRLLRGLIHSDGARVTNWTTRRLRTGVRRYEYPRYFFTNKSDDIRLIYTDTLDAVGVEWKQANAWNVSVARRESVALMDEHIGPKH
jgi:hypothetical protein